MCCGDFINYRCFCQVLFQRDVRSTRCGIWSITITQFYAIFYNKREVPKRTLKNLEFKANCESLDVLRERLANLQAEHHRTMKQLDTYFNVPQGRLKLREINTDEAQLIYYERSDLAESRYSNYQVCSISEPMAFNQIATMAWGVKGVVEKQRELWMFGDTRIHLDEVRNLGQFVELETVIREQTEEEAQAEHQLVKDALGIKEEDLVSVSYNDLI